MVGFINKTFDDTDTTHIVYSTAGHWIHGSWNASSIGQSGTLSVTNDLFDGNVTFIFPEPAIGFYYYGIRRSKGGRYGICVDCDPFDLKFETIDALNITDDGTNPPVLLWSRRFDVPGVHRIILQNQPDARFPNTNNNSQITIDRFELEVVDPNAPPSAVTVIASPTSTTVTSPALSSISKGNVGTIIGGVVGGLVFLFFILALWYWRLRRRKKRQITITKADGFNPTPGRIPVSEQHSMSEIPIASTMVTADTKGRHTRGVSQTTNHHGSGPSFGSSDLTVPTTSSGLRAEAVQRTREVDAGPLGETDGDMLPPEYAQLFRRMSTNSGRPVRVASTNG